MTGYLFRVLAHRLHEGRSLFLLTVLGVALGVASVLSIQVLNRSSVGAFSGALKAVSGAADLSVLPVARTLPEEFLVTVLATPGVASAWPVIEVDVALEGAEDVYLQLFGIDVFSHVGIPWRPEGGKAGSAASGSPDEDPRGAAPPGRAPGSDGGLVAALSTPGWVAISPRLAERYGWRVGSRFAVSSGTRRFELTVGTLIDFEAATPTAGSKLMVMDLGPAQVLLGLPGVLSRIDLRVASPDRLEAVRASLAGRLGPEVEVLTPAARERRTEGLLEAFRLNLTALSGISLVVGFFLVFSATRAALSRRRRELGLLRALGASRAQVLGLLAVEVALLGLLGVAIGIPLGLGAAQANLGTVAGSLSNLYLIEETERLVVPPHLVPLGILLGILGALIGGLGPAWESAVREPTELLAAYTRDEGVTLGARRKAGYGLLLLALAGAGYAGFGDRFQASGFGLAAAVCLALPLFSPALIRGVAGRLGGAGFGFRYALRTLERELATAGYAVSALAIAVSMLFGVGIMVESFRRTVGDWVAETLVADVYLTSRSWRRAGADAGLDPDLVSGLRAMPEVVAMDRLRRFFSRLGDRRVLVNAVDLEREEAASRSPLVAGPADAARRLRAPGTCMVSEPLARRFGVGVGDRIELPGPGGPVALSVLAVYHDYTTDLGEVTVHLDRVEALAGPGPLQSLSVFLAPGVSPEEMVDRIRARLPGAPLWVRSNRTLREEVFRIFDQTFAVTRLLQAMALLVAACTLALTLLVIARERTRELALYAALGATPLAVARVFLGKGLAIGLMGLALGAVGGATLAAILIFAVNPAYFGWTLRAHLPWSAVAGQAATILATALFASLPPAWIASRTGAAELSREDG